MAPATLTTNVFTKILQRMGPQDSEEVCSHCSLAVEKVGSSGKTQIVFFAPVNQMVHNGPNVTEWYTVLHHELKTVHNLAHEI